MSRSVVELDNEFIEERALEALEGLNLTLDSDPEIIESLSAEEVKEELQAIGTSTPFGKWNDLLALIEGDSVHVGGQDGGDLDIEKDILVRMQPIKSQKVNIRARNLGRARLRVVVDPLSDE
jgi:hypothetical protein